MMKYIGNLKTRTAIADDWPHNRMHPYNFRGSKSAKCGFNFRHSAVALVSKGSSVSKIKCTLSHRHSQGEK